MSGKASTSRVASAYKPHSQCTSQFQRGHHTSRSSPFETFYFGFSSIFKELASYLCPHISSCVLPSQGSLDIHQINHVESLQTCMLHGSHSNQAAQKPATSKGVRGWTQLLPQKGSFSLLNFNANYKIIAQAKEVLTNLFEKLTHSGTSTPHTIHLRLISNKEVALPYPHLNSLSQNFPVNHMSRSHFMSRGILKYFKPLLKKILTACSNGHSFEDGTKTVYLENSSTTAKTNLKPSNFGNPSMKSID